MAKQEFSSKRQDRASGALAISDDAVSADGSVIARSGVNPAGQYEAWIANISPPTLSISRGADRDIPF